MGEAQRTHLGMEGFELGNAQLGRKGVAGTVVGIQIKTHGLHDDPLSKCAPFHNVLFFSLCSMVQSRFVTAQEPPDFKRIEVAADGPGKVSARAWKRLSPCLCRVAR